MFFQKAFERGLFVRLNPVVPEVVSSTGCTGEEVLDDLVAEVRKIWRLIHRSLAKQIWRISLVLSQSLRSEIRPVVCKMMMLYGCFQK